MSRALTGRRIAFLVANSGVEQVELTTPWQTVQDAGGQPVLIAPEKEPVQAVHHDTELADTFDPERVVAEVDPADFDALVLPGGVGNPDKLRLIPEAVAFVRDMAAAGKPIAAICHGPWTLVEADILGGKSLTSWPSLQTDIRNAGGLWRDQQLVTCSEQGYTLITSRNPDDLDAFTAGLLQEFAG